MKVDVMNPPPVNPESELIQPLILQGEPLILQGEPLILEAVAEPIEDPPILVSVKAPSNLVAGFVFDATVELNGESKIVKVKVPQGGARKGQTITVPLPIVINAPTGIWKDGLCDCFMYGICHPSCLCACFVNPIAMAQIMTRMRLNFLGLRGAAPKSKNAFLVVLVVYIVFLYLPSTGTLISIQDSNKDPHHEPHDHHGGNPHSMIKNYTGEMSQSLKLLTAFSSLISIYFLVALSFTRNSVRNYYSIPGNYCGDIVCATFCSICAVSQMARHTGDYEKYKGKCFSYRGLPKDAPPNIFEV